MAKRKAVIDEEPTFFLYFTAMTFVDADGKKHFWRRTMPYAYELHKDDWAGTGLVRKRDEVVQKAIDQQTASGLRLVDRFDDIVEFKMHDVWRNSGLLMLNYMDRMGSLDVIPQRGL